MTSPLETIDSENCSNPAQTRGNQSRTMLCLLLLGASAGMLLPAQAQENFTKITSGPIPNESARSIAAGWVDFDGDGDLDLFAGNPDGANLLYRNDGQGVFTKLTTGAIVNAGPNSFAAAWADMNNDGRLDLYIAKDGGPSLLFVQKSDGTFTRSTLPMSTISGAAWADYDGDGFVDLLSADNAAGMLWRNNGAGGLSLAPGNPINVSGVGVTTWADYDGDGDMDALVVASAFRGGTITRLFRNDGAGKFTAITSGAFAQQNIPFTGATWGDYDNDGFPDVFVSRYVPGQEVVSYLFHNNGDGTFTAVADSPVATDTGSAVGGSWADYDNDGWLDLLITDTGGSNNRLYHNSGDGTFTRVLSGPIVSEGGGSSNGTWGDYDGNGFLDLYVSNSGNENDYLYRNDGNSNGWIIVKCVGTRSNRSAIGAKVRIKATIGGKTVWQFREISTGTGWNESSMDAHFGLGDATNVQTLRIEWPSGTIQEFQNVPGRQYKTITEPARLTPPSAKDVSHFTLQGGRTLQYEIQTSTDLSAWSTLNSVTITNLDGTASITDGSAPNSARRFYRTLLR